MWHYITEKLTGMTLMSYIWVIASLIVIAFPIIRYIKVLRFLIQLIKKRGGRYFSYWLIKKHLGNFITILKAISEQIKSNNAGAFNYTNKVWQHLVNADTVLALCGRKFTTEAENHNYFQKFYDFAYQRSLINSTHTPNDIYNCRVFVGTDRNSIANKGFTPLNLNVINNHRLNRSNGILALTIPWGPHNNIAHVIDKEFLTSLDNGFGFLLFYSKNGVLTVITHEGIDKNLAFMELSDILSIQRVLKTFHLLCKNSEEYLNNPIERINVDKMLEAIKISVDQ